MIGFAGANTQYARSSGSELLTDFAARKKRRAKQSAPLGNGVRVIRSDRPE
jgi:hypothetical protein